MVSSQFLPVPVQKAVQISLPNLNVAVKYYIVVTMIILEKGSIVVSINRDAEILTAVVDEVHIVRTGEKEVKN